MRDLETVSTEVQDFMRGWLGQHLILGGDFHVSFNLLTDYHHVGESIPRPRTLTDTNGSLHARALHAVVAGDEHLDGRRLRTGQLDGSWRRADTNGLYHNLEETGSKTGANAGLRLVQDRPWGGACCSFAESENETLCETCMAKNGHRDVDRMEKLGCGGGPSLRKLQRRTN